MTSKRNLGPVLALTGAGIAVAAVIAGFILVGGPGDARERRLDSATMNRVYDAVTVAQCSLNITGAAPQSIEEAHKLTPPPTQEIPVPQPCGSNAPVHSQITTGEYPAGLGDVVYRAMNTTEIRVCASFRRPFSEGDNREYYGQRFGPYHQLDEPHPAGVHCYDVQLFKGADMPTKLNSHAGHMDVFE